MPTNAKYTASKRMQHLKDFHSKEIARLRNARNHLNPEIQKERYERFTQMIDQSVIDFQIDVRQNDRHYFDCHGQTVKGAVNYIDRMMQRVNRVKVCTGRGNGSKDGVPAIKEALQEVYENKDRFEMKTNPENDGILWLKKKF